MAFQVSPGVNVSEIDLTSVVPAVSVSVGAVAGVFRWGPVNERVLISNEKQLVATFGQPASYFKDTTYTNQWRNYETFYTASNFLNYSNGLYVVRTAGGDTVTGAHVFAPTVGDGGSTGTITLSGTDFRTSYGVGDVITVAGTVSNNTAFTINSFQSNGSEMTVTATDQLMVGETAPADATSTNAAKTAYSANFQAKYQGVLGNSIAVSFCSTTSAGASSFEASAFANNIEITPFTNTGVASSFLTENEALTLGGVASSGDNVILSDGTNLKISSIVATPVAGGASTIAIDNTDSTVSTSLIATVVHTYANNAGKGEVTSATSADDFSVFQPGEQIVISGSDNNDGTYIVDATTTATTLVVTTAFGTEEPDTGFPSYQGEPDGDINVTTNQFYVRDHGLESGDALTYTSAAAPENEIGGLDDGSTYYAIVIDSDYFQLSSTYAGAIAVSPSVVDITSFGTGAGHEFATTDSFNASITFVDTFTGISAYSGQFSVQWADAGLFSSAPSNNHVHIVVRDTGGLVTGTVNAVVETYNNVSTVPGAVSADGSANYLRDILTDSSNYIECSSPSSLVVSAKSEQQELQYGSDGADEVNIPIGSIAAGYDLFKDASTVDISLLMQGKARGGTTLANYITNNIADSRKDCVAFVSPEQSDTSVDSVVNFSSTLSGSTYMVVDSGYKYQYDKFNDLYRWIPLNGDIAGLCARTDETRDPWFSPAGVNRGIIKNVVKLRINPTKTERDLLYLNNVNPVISQPGSGTFLFGDKTNSPIASAFDRINVRRLFIVLEKAIAAASRSLLFEFNDEFTRAQFKNLVEPFLREVQGRRGIYDFRVICDTTNNTAEVIDTNQFIGDIFIKPARAINFIQLNFVAVRTGVEFEEIVGSV
jgi:phage tail sheath protein FI